MAEVVLEARAATLLRVKRRVVDRVSVSLWATEWLAVVGPNGAGKSSLLSMMAGLKPCVEGDVLLRGRPVAAWAPMERARLLAWLPQQGEADGEIAARDVVRLGRLPHHGVYGVCSAADEAAVQEAMQATECSAFASRPLNTLSGGERQRVLVARALAVQAQVLLLDEPTTFLDPPHQVMLARLFRMLGRTRTVVTVLHDLQIAAQADRLLVMQAGRAVAAGAPYDPIIQQALVTAFGGAIRWSTDAGAAHIALALED